jgi:hypothetical protein
MRSKILAILTIAIGLAVSVPLFAHHGAASFDSGEKVVLKGTVKEWIYSNPHCLLTLDVKGEDGKMVEWIAETQAPAVMYPAGYRKDSFKPGDEVTVTVEPVKSGRAAGRIISAITADGTELGNLNSKPRPAAESQGQ